jgi:hypothetical protein
MSNTQEKIMESLAGMLPDEAQEKVASAVSSIIDDLSAEHEAAYNDKLAEAYAQMSEENEANVKKAEAEFEKAYSIINDLRNRFEIHHEELEGRLYEEYDARLKDIKEYMVDKVDEFLAIQGEKFYEMAKQEVINDPAIVEHKVAFDKIVDVVGGYISDEEMLFNTSVKVDGLHESLEKVSKEKRLLEAKIIRLESDNNKLNEVAGEAQQLLEEQMLNEQKEWVERSRNAEGRGEVSDKEREVLLGEYASKETTTEINEHSQYSEPETIVEQWQHLAGMNDDK